MCHFSVRPRHPLSQLTNELFIAKAVIAQSHGLNLALFLRLNAAPYKGIENGKFATEPAHRAGE